MVKKKRPNGEGTEAERAGRDALKHSRDTGDRAGAASALKELGDLYARTDRAAEAEAAYGEALSIHRDLGAEQGAADVLRALGSLYEGTDRHPDAVSAYTAALPRCRAVGDLAGLADASQSLGSLAAMGGDLAAAWAFFVEALGHHRAIDDDVGVAADHGYLGRIANMLERWDQAIVLSGTALWTLRRIGLPDGQEIALQYLYTAFANKDDHQSSICALAQAWEFFRSRRDPRKARCEPLLLDAIADFDPKRPFPAKRLADVTAALDYAIATTELALVTRKDDRYAFPVTA